MYKNGDFNDKIPQIGSNSSAKPMLNDVLFFLKNPKILIGSYTWLGVLFSLNFSKIGGLTPEGLILESLRFWCNQNRKINHIQKHKVPRNYLENLIIGYQNFLL